VTTILATEHLAAGYGGIVALRDVSISLQEGTFTCVIGSNGAGKSTLMNCISGVVRATAGDITFRGSSVAGRKPEQVAGLRILQVPEGRRVLAPLTVRDNLLLGGTPAGLRGAREKESLDRVYALFPKLEQRASQLSGSLSGGEQQMLAIGRALMGQPEVLLLDEPSLGLAPVIVSEVYRALRELKESGLTTLIVEQNANLALRVSDYGYVLQRGIVLTEGPSVQLLEDSSVTEAYLGRAAREALSGAHGDQLAQRRDTASDGGAAR
jgi:branched-chain amino acid transport system ATP-binding protein